jgi:hypothetical protein
MRSFPLVVFMIASGFNAWGQPYALTNQHCDIRVVYQPDATNQLGLSVRDSDRAITYEPEEVILTATEASRLTLPGDFPPLGQAGAPIWVLPATQDPQLLYLGISGDGIPSGVFDGPVEIRLLATSGPGDFFVWQVGETGALEFQMDTTDGTNELDTIPLYPGGHSHHNWGFTSNGIVTVTFQATAQRVGATTNETSLATDLVFHVLPIPEAPETPFGRWQKTHWPDATDPAVIGPDADPDRDDFSNVFEYAFALDPRTPDADGAPEVSIREVAGEYYGVLTFRQALAATDLRFEPVAGGSLAAPDWLPITDIVDTTDRETYRSISVRDAVPLSGNAARFFQLRLTFE